MYLLAHYYYYYAIIMYVLNNEILQTKTETKIVLETLSYRNSLQHFRYIKLVDGFMVGYVKLTPINDLWWMVSLGWSKSYKNTQVHKFSKALAIKIRWVQAPNLPFKLENVMAVCCLAYE